MATTDGDPRPTPTDVIERMQADLVAAMRQRDRVRRGTLRTVLAAIANAEAPPIGAAGEGEPNPAGHGPAEPVVGRLVDHERLVLTAADIDRIIGGEIDDRLDTIAQIEPHGRHDEADILRAEVAVLATYRR